MGQFDEYDSSEESGQEFPSDLEVSDEEGEADGDAPKAPKANGKAATTAAGTKRKAPPRDPKKGAKRREWLFCVLKSIRTDGAQDRRWMWSTRWRRNRCRGNCSRIGSRLPFAHDVTIDAVTMNVPPLPWLTAQSRITPHQTHPS